MARPTLLKLALVVVLTMAASTAFAAVSTFSGSTSVGGTSFSSSNKSIVYGMTDNQTAGTFTSTTYAIAAGHISGDKAIAAKAGDSSLYYSAVAAGAATTTAAAISTTTVLAGTWTSM